MMETPGRLYPSLVIEGLKWSFLGGCVLPPPSHWDLHCSPLSLHGLWLPVDVDCGVSLGAISQLVEGVCLGDRQPFLHLPQPREFSHSGVDVSRCQ